MAAIMTIPVLLLLLLNSRPQTSRWTKGYINEKVNELPHEYPKYSGWKANNMLVVSWLLNCVEPDIGEGLYTVNMAKKIWNTLYELHG